MRLHLLSCPGIALLAACTSSTDLAQTEDAVVGPLPAPWQTANVGPAGSAAPTYDPASMLFSTHSGTGDILGNSDSFRFVYQTLDHNGTITARVDSLTGATGAKAGLMIRSSNAAGAAYVAILIAKGQAARFQHRDSLGGPTSSATGPNVQPPFYVKLERTTGNQFTGSVSSNGNNWTMVGNTAVVSAIGTTPEVGFASGAHSGSQESTATFDSVGMSWVKQHYGHYVAARWQDINDLDANGNPIPATTAEVRSWLQTVCAYPGVSGVYWRQAWGEVDTGAASDPPTYNWSAVDVVRDNLPAGCQFWIMFEWKSFGGTYEAANPCPRGVTGFVNSSGGGAKTCPIWDTAARNRFANLVAAAGNRYDGNPKFEGLIFEETSIGFNGAPPAGYGDGTAYTDALVYLINACDSAFPTSRCLSFMNFIAKNQTGMNDMSDALSALANNRGCVSGPDILPGDDSLYNSPDKAYPVNTKHTGCRSNSAQNNSYSVHQPPPPSGGTDWDMSRLFNWAVGGTFGTFDTNNPWSNGGLCINSYLFWNYGPTGQTFKFDGGANDTHDAKTAIANNPYGAGWYGQCSGGDQGPP